VRTFVPCFIADNCTDQEQDWTCKVHVFFVNGRQRASLSAGWDKRRYQASNAPYHQASIEKFWNTKPDENLQMEAQSKKKIPGNLWYYHNTRVL
jgi:hypothetical protein